MTKLAKARYPFLEKTLGMNFGNFIDWYVNSKNIYSYSDYLLIHGELPKNVYILKLENLKKDAKKIINKKLGLKVNFNDLPRKNKTKHKNPKYYYDKYKGTKDKVIARYRWTFDNGLYKPEI
jgi:hypothetical protein